MAQLWYVDQAGLKDGPLSADELRERAADGRLTPADRVSPDGRRWAAASKVKGLRFETPTSTYHTVPTVVLPLSIDPDAAAITIPGYEVHSVLGSGGCGMVFRATQRRLDRVVALKTIRLQHGVLGNALARFEREAVALAKLQHPNIVGVFDYGHHDGRVFMAMELLDGEDLERRIKRLGRLDERTVWAITRQTAAALAHAAKLGIIHRDVKPANLFLVPPPSVFGLPDDLPMVKVMDFGLAFTKRADLSENDRLTHAGVVLGTPAYMAPEQFAGGTVDHRADIYALGATVYHALAGHPPFKGTTMWEMMAKKGESAPKLEGGVSVESARLVAAMLTPDPDRRVANYDDLIRRIDALSATTEISPEMPSRHWYTRKRMSVVVVALGIAVAAAVFLATNLGASGPRLASGPPPAVVVAGRPEMLSDRANFASWEIEGKATFERDDEGVPVLHTSGAVRWAFRPSAADRLSIGFDPHRADTVDLQFANTLGLRVSRKDGVVAGEFRPDGTFRPITTVTPFPAAEAREGLVPYLSVELQLVGNRWDIWFDHRHVGGINIPEPATGYLHLRTDGRTVRVERIELERMLPGEIRPQPH